MNQSGTIASSYNVLKECPKCGRHNRHNANFCDKCRYAFWISERKHIDDLTQEEIRDVKEFYSKKDMHKKFKNVDDLIADLND